MKAYFQPLIWVVLVCYTCGTGQAQTPVDALLMGKGQLCAALQYDYGVWDQYWEGDYLRTNRNIGQLSRQSIMPMVAYGLLDNVNLIAAVPYIRTSSTGGQMAPAQGIQDLNLALKARWLDRPVGPGQLNVLTTLGVATPLGNYLSDYQPYSLGLGANELSLRLIGRYRLPQGPYLRAMAAHLWRGQTEVERDYYYQNGSYYTPWMDVPNAWQLELAAGSWLFQDRWRVEAGYQGLKSTSGDDIRWYNMGQPTNRVMIDQVSVLTQYYFTHLPLGISASWTQVLAGRNMGKFSNLSLALLFQMGEKS